MTSQIVNLKTIGEVFVLKKCYQCGGETLGTVVKHSVSDSTNLKSHVIKMCISLFSRFHSRHRFHPSVPLSFEIKKIDINYYHYNEQLLIAAIFIVSRTGEWFNNLQIQFNMI